MWEFVLVWEVGGWWWEGKEKYGTVWDSGKQKYGTVWDSQWVCVCFLG